MSTLKKTGGWRVFMHVALLRPLLRLLLGVNITGRDHLLGLTQYIIIANHNSHLDILLLFYILNAGHISRTHAVADKAYFSRNRLVFRIVNYLFRPVWITRGELDSRDDPLERFRTYLDAGDNLIIFPEGTRGTPGELARFKSGIGRLVTQCPDIPIVPVFLTGPERALPKASALLLPLWNNIVIGPPQKCHGTHRDITRLLQEILDELAHSEASRRHQRSDHLPDTLTCIAFIGIDGSGKSTMSTMTARALSVSRKACCISDELRFYESGHSTDIQPLLTEIVRRKISSYAKKAKSLKLYKIPKLTELLLRDHILGSVRRWYRPRYVAMDGSPLLNLLAWSVLYKEDGVDEASCSKAIAVLTDAQPKISNSDPVFEKFPELLQLKRIGVNRLHLPDIVLFIDVTPDEACRRIDSRGEERQVHETKEKLSRLRNGYLMVCKVIQDDWNVPVMIVDGSASREEVFGSCISFLTGLDAIEVNKSE